MHVVVSSKKSQLQPQMPLRKVAVFTSNTPCPNHSSHWQSFLSSSLQVFTFILHITRAVAAGCTAFVQIVLFGLLQTLNYFRSFHLSVCGVAGRVQASCSRLYGIYPAHGVSFFKNQHHGENWVGAVLVSIPLTLHSKPKPHQPSFACAGR